jgi:hypothetical protein
MEGGEGGAPRDWLLQGGRMAIWLLMALFGAGAVLALAALLVSLVGYAGAFGPVPDTAWALSPQRFPYTVMLLLLGMAAMAIGFGFVLLLGRIVASVGKGDPFSRTNAHRLQSMAWLALAFQGVSLIMFWQGMDVGRISPIGALISGHSLSFNALFLALVLFILARVFLKGAEMRDDLDGTV